VLAMVSKHSELVKRQARDRYGRFASPMSTTAPPHSCHEVGSLATTWRQTDLSKSMGVPFAPYKYPLMVKVDTHHILEIPLAKLLFLV
jgi:hypothetical protein